MLTPVVVTLFEGSRTLGPHQQLIPIQRSDSNGNYKNCDSNSHWRAVSVLDPHTHGPLPRSSVVALGRRVVARGGVGIVSADTWLDDSSIGVTCAIRGRHHRHGSHRDSSTQEETASAGSNRKIYDRLGGWGEVALDMGRRENQQSLVLLSDMRRTVSVRIRLF